MVWLKYICLPTLFLFLVILWDLVFIDFSFVLFSFIFVFEQEIEELQLLIWEFAEIKLKIGEFEESWFKMD